MASVISYIPKKILLEDCGTTLQVRNVFFPGQMPFEEVYPTFDASQILEGLHAIASAVTLVAASHVYDHSRIKTGRSLHSWSGDTSVHPLI